MKINMTTIGMGLHGTAWVLNVFAVLFSMFKGFPNQLWIMNLCFVFLNGYFFVFHYNKWQDDRKLDEFFEQCEGPVTVVVGETQRDGTEKVVESFQASMKRTESVTQTDK